MATKLERIWISGTLVASSLLASGCTDARPYVEGEVRLGADVQPLDGQYLLVRAIPDHVDGFDPKRVYHGDEVFAEHLPVDEIAFPHAFHIIGDEPQSVDVPWVLLAWLSDDPHDTWIHPGQRFGAVQFELAHVAYGPLYADGLDVTIAGTAPPD